MVKKKFSWVSVTHWTEHSSWPGPWSAPIKVPGHHRAVRPDFTLREDSLATSGADVISWLQGKLGYNQQPDCEEGPPRQKPSSAEYWGRPVGPEGMRMGESTLLHTPRGPPGWGSVASQRSLTGLGPSFP